MRRLLPMLALAAALLAGCGGDANSDGSGASANDCREVEAPAPREPEQLSPPTKKLDSAKTYQLRFDTNCGEFTVALDLESAPKTAASLVSLAEQGYLDDTIFHRIVPDFVIQGGDPTQTGGGGPGYTTVDPPPQDARYVKGVVAMAKTADEPPGASGSQFFVVTAPEVTLGPDYAIVGNVLDEDLDVVERIGALGDATEQPTQTVLLEKVTVVES
ncbi:MAG TPA: peptidylprolyl isomerase [Gaiellaceae bacterium]|nr:peptidylprolyl isomerase [Gaiellaceae bacterium]